MKKIIEKPTKDFFCYSLQHWTKAENWSSSKTINNRVQHLCKFCQAGIDASRMKHKKAVA